MKLNLKIIPIIKYYYNMKLYTAFELIQYMISKNRRDFMVVLDHFNSTLLTRTRYENANYCKVLVTKHELLTKQSLIKNIYLIKPKIHNK
jgi:hypothetical protein